MEWVGGWVGWLRRSGVLGGGASLFITKNISQKCFYDGFCEQAWARAGCWCDSRGRDWGQGVLGGGGSSFWRRIINI